MATKRKISELNFDHDFENLFPPVAGEEYENLKKSITKHGVMDTIKTWNGVVVDGHTRLRVCKELGIGEVFVSEIQFDKKSDAMNFMLAYQKGRRKMTPEQIVLANNRIKAQLKREAKERQAEYHGNQYDQKSGLTANLPEVHTKKSNTGEVMEQLAKNAGVSRHTYEGMEYIVNNGTRGQIDRLNKGESVSGLQREVMATKQGKTVRICNKCGRAFPFSEFKGHSGNCRECEKKRKEQYNNGGTKADVKVAKKLKLNQFYQDDDGVKEVSLDRIEREVMGSVDTFLATIKQISSDNFDHGDRWKEILVKAQQKLVSELAEM